MPSKKVYSVPVELGGKTRHLRYDWNAFVELEREYGITLDGIGNILADADGKVDKDGKPVISMSPIRIRFIVWAGLIHEDKELSVDDVGEMLDLGNMVDLFEKVGQAFAGTFPDDEDVKKKPLPLEKIPEAKKSSPGETT